MDAIVPVLRAILGLGLGPGLGFVLAAAAPPVARPFDGFPGITIERHEVSGTTVAEIRESIDRLELVDPSSGIPVDAYTRWTIQWWIPGRPDGECRLDQAEVTLEVTVALPQLADPDRVPPRVMRQWRRYMAALEAHEATHARHAYEGREAVLRAIRDAECRTAEPAVDDAIDAIRRRDADYDGRTRHGRTEGVIFR